MKVVLLLECVFYLVFFFFKQKTAYEMRISDWSSDVCSSDLNATPTRRMRTGTSTRGPMTAAKATGEARPKAAIATAIASSKLLPEAVKAKIGRASCRERVCQYV